MQPQPAQSLIGSVLEGAYRIVRLMGEGGMGAVYEATQLRLNKRVAVKVMASALSVNPEALARFRREAEVTSGIGHPHIVQVFDFGATPTGEPFLVMEFLEGEDLEHRIRRSGCLSLTDTLHIIKQVAAALSATHAKGIVHRDLKPANIYLLAATGEADFVKVLDFGISKVRDATTKLTRATMVMGTPNYMAPEQALGQVDQIDGRTDQWALACMTWECLSGESPFAGESVPSILFRVVHEPPPAPKVAGLCPAVVDVLLRALAKNKDDRFPDVAEFARVLEEASAQAPASMQRPIHVSPTVVAGAPTTTLTHSAGSMEEAQQEKAGRSKRIAIGGGIAVLLGGALLAGVVLLSRQPVTLPPPREARALPTQTQASLTPPSPPPSQAADEVTEVPTAAPTIEPPPPKAEKKSAGRSGKPKLAKVAHALSHVAPSVSATAPAPTTVPVSPAPPPQQPQQVFAPQGGRKW